MILFFKSLSGNIVAAGATNEISSHDIEKLVWLFGGAEQIEQDSLEGYFVGPRKEMLTPWSTNAVEITQNMGVDGIERIRSIFW